MPICGTIVLLAQWNLYADFWDKRRFFVFYPCSSASICALDTKQTISRRDESILSIIDSLSAGYRFLTRHLELILIPIVLDLILWLAPRLSAAPLFEQAADFYREASAMSGLTGELVEMSEQAAELLAGVGESSNLLDLLLWLSNSLLHLPSLLFVMPPLNNAVRNVTSLFTAFALASLFSILGIAIGVTYLKLLARRLPIGAGAKNLSWRAFPASVLRHSLQVLLFVFIFVAVLLALMIPVSFGVALFSLLLPGLSPIFVFLLGGLVMVMVLYLYFVPAGLILDDLRLPTAVMQSFRLVRDNFWATIGLILLSQLISLGFTLILGRFAVYQPFGTLVAIILHAYIGTGLVMGLLIFYRSRILLAQGETITL